VDSGESEGEHVQGYAFQIVRISHVQRAQLCHMLTSGQTEAKKKKRPLARNAFLGRRRVRSSARNPLGLETRDDSVRSPSCKRALVWSRSCCLLGRAARSSKATGRAETVSTTTVKRILLQRVTPYGQSNPSWRSMPRRSNIVEAGPIGVAHRPRPGGDKSPAGAFLKKQVAVEATPARQGHYGPMFDETKQKLEQAATGWRWPRRT